MSIHNRHHSLSILSALFLATASFSDSSLAATAKSANNGSKLKLKPVAESSSQTQIPPQIIGSAATNLQNVYPAPATPEIILADFSLDSFTGQNSEDYTVDSSKSSIINIVRRTALVCFLLLFLPLGLFYPFFLFYKRLFELNQNDTDDTSVPQDLESEFPRSTNLKDDELESKPQLVNAADLKVVSKAEQVTFSQLQIAFYPESSNFRQQLKVIDANQHIDIAEKMHQTIALLVTQQDWTHANCSFSPLSVKKAHGKFEEVLFVEQDKQINQKLSLVSARKLKSPDGYSLSNKYKYTVVTMLFCFANSYALSENVTTKEDLAKQLIKLSVIEREDIVKFQLLWNPTSEGEYLSNEQLLSDYQGLTRLF